MQKNQGLCPILLLTAHESQPEKTFDQYLSIMYIEFYIYILFKKIYT